MAKQIARAIMTALRASTALALLLLALPLLLVSGLHAMWRAFDLWAFYDGDEGKRQKAEWGR
jgi:hypothetical protein